MCLRKSADIKPNQESNVTCTATPSDCNSTNYAGLKKKCDKNWNYTLTQPSTDTGTDDTGSSSSTTGNTDNNSSTSDDNTLMYVIIGVVVVLILCGAGFYCYSKSKGGEHDEDEGDLD